ncbi:MAG: AAA family ATPase [Chloroflexi bacterium CFX4]|nr:AAA family ATPase [Chloroflexi bacterium CFX4]MDL1920989.1 AAA family ATPase [Chloroflexi bacterium CFX3]
MAEHMPFPFLALVGQTEMRVALLLAVINPNVGGVLLIGPRGTGKTTAVRSLSDILPEVEVSTCEEGCLPEDFEREGAAGVCPNCAAKLARGEPITRWTAVKMVELPLNARLEDVVGGVNERIAMQQQRVRLERGILARADQNILYVDEVNLLEDNIVDAILDAAAAGSYTVRRGAMVGTYRSRFVLIGSMNPEEGNLRPQLMDRFGLRVVVRGLMAREDRLEIYRRVSAFRSNPKAFLRQWAGVMAEARTEIENARDLLKQVALTEQALDLGLTLVRELDIDSHRAEFTLFEAARAYAAADGRTQADVGDVQAVAAMALRQRRSEFMVQFAQQQQAEDETIRQHAAAKRNAQKDGQSA